jgi:hypothetical protein
LLWWHPFRLLRGILLLSCPPPITFHKKKIEMGLPNEWSGTTATTSQVQSLTEETKLNRQAAPQSVCRADFSTHKKKRKKRSITYLDVYPIWGEFWVLLCLLLLLFISFFPFPPFWCYSF